MESLPRERHERTRSFTACTISRTERRALAVGEIEVRSARGRVAIPALESPGRSDGDLSADGQASIIDGEARRSRRGRRDRRQPEEGVAHALESVAERLLRRIHSIDEATRL